MAESELGLKIDGRLGAMDAEAVAIAMRALLRLLGPPPAGEEDGEAPVWALTTLTQGSAVLAVAPGGVVSAEAHERVANIKNGLRQLEQGPGEPAGWNSEDVDNLLEFQRIVGLSGVTGLSFWFSDETPPVLLAGDLLDNARESLAVARTSLGSVTGKINRWNTARGHREVGLQEASTGRAVTVSYPAEMEPDMLAALGQEVTIWGEVRRSADGRKRSVRAEGLEVISYGLPEPIEHLVGVLGDWTDGVDAVEFVQRQRRG